MKPEQLERARRLFGDAMTRETDARAAYLLEACPDDPEVRAEVERWLEHDTAVAPTSQIHEAVQRALEMTVPTGTVVSHYRLEEKVGAGGMGEVFRASDLALGRETAVKVIPATLARERRDRLLAEARTSARLQHPGIATMYEGGEADDGIAFLAMEFVDGETLRARLRREPMAIDEALRTAASLLEALAHAHSHGVVHRDIKPENVMLREDGTVKLLDFGVAKRLDVTELDLDPDAAAVEETRRALIGLTRHGSVVGTIGYMSPEQLRGETVDARTDLFAVGAVLYEMMTARPAFPGTTVAERIASTVSGDLPSLDVPGAGPDVEAVVRRALARDPSGRYSSASQFLRALHELASREAIAILPDTLAIVEFTVEGDAHDDWIGASVAESLVAALARVDRLSIVPREKMEIAASTSGDDGTVAMGLALGCRWVLDGSVVREGPTLRITHRLCEVATGTIVHTGDSEGMYDDLFALQNRLATTVADHLDVVLPERSNDRFVTQDLDAHECAVRGQKLVARLERGSLASAETFLLRAIELEPDHAPAHAALASLHSPSRWIVTTEDRELELAEMHARRAIDIDPTLGQAHVSLGYSLWRRKRGTEALECFARAIAPSTVVAQAEYFAANTLLDMNRPTQALEHARRAVVADPQWGFALSVLGNAHLFAGNFLEALWAGEQAEELERRGSPFPPVGTAILIADILRRLGRLEDARRRVLRAFDAIEASDHPFRDLVRVNGLVVLGAVAVEQSDPSAARAAMTQCLTQLDGRPRGLGSGFSRCTALATLAELDHDLDRWNEAVRLYVDRAEHDFNWAGASDLLAVEAFGRGARVLDRESDLSGIRRARTAFAPR